MRFRQVKSALVLFWGWPVILGTAAIILTCDVSNAVAYPLILLVVFWFLLSVVALFVYFYRAWKRVGLASNKAAYIVWLSIESMFALAAVVIVWSLVTPS
jgi:hypothetical protein